MAQSEWCHAQLARLATDNCDRLPVNDDSCDSTTRVELNVVLGIAKSRRHDPERMHTLRKAWEVPDFSEGA